MKERQDGRSRWKRGIGWTAQGPSRSVKRQDGSKARSFAARARAAKLRELSPGLITLSDNGGERQEPQGRGGDPRVHHQPSQASPWLVIPLARHRKP